MPYGLPYETDIRVLYYNKAAFKEAGLDPNTPPKNWDDLWSFSDKLAQKDGNKLKRIGFFPTFGNAGLDQWAWNNGGQWQDANLRAFRDLNMGFASALAWILFVIIMIVTGIQLWLSKRWVYYES